MNCVAAFLQAGLKQALAEAGTQVYGTDINGTIGVSTDGKTYEIKKQRQ